MAASISRKKAAARMALRHRQHQHERRGIKQAWRHLVAHGISSVAAWRSNGAQIEINDIVSNGTRRQNAAANHANISYQARRHAHRWRKHGSNIINDAWHISVSTPSDINIAARSRIRSRRCGAHRDNIARAVAHQQACARIARHDALRHHQHRA